MDLAALSDSDSVIHAGDLELPAGVTMITDPGAYVARIITHAAVTEEEDEAAAEAAAEAPAATEEPAAAEEDASSE